jgi:hypothetical protein
LSPWHDQTIATFRCCCLLLDGIKQMNHTNDSAIEMWMTKGVG